MRTTTTSPSATASLSELAEDWLEVKSFVSTGDPANSTRARKVDLCQWARAIATIKGLSVPQRPRNGVDLDEDLTLIELGDLTTDNLLQAFKLLRATYASSTLVRQLSTIRQWCNWLHKRGHLESDPSNDDYLVHRLRKGDADGAIPYRSFTVEDIDRIRTAALDPPARAHSAWPTRDLAIIEVLAGCGPRAAEVCGLQLRHAELNAERPMLRIVIGAKGGLRRDVPIPDSAVDAIGAYMAERTQVTATDQMASLFVRRNGRPLDTSVLDRIVRRLAGTAGVAMPGEAAAHAFRHSYGEGLAVRGVPVPVIQQLLGHASASTTAIYTRVASPRLVAALDDAGWLRAS
jgi:integrase/recombinase XerD